MLDVAPRQQAVWGPGRYRLAVASVEFPDVAEAVAGSWLARIVHEADAYFREVSAGAVRWIATETPPSRIRLRRPSAAWHLDRRSLTDRVHFWKRLMANLDVEGADAVLMVVPRAAVIRGCFAVGPRWNSPRLDDALRSLDAPAPRGAVVKTSTPWGTIMHELGHIMGLPDLYDYEFDRDRQRWSVRASRYVGSWDLMGRVSPRSTSLRPHPMAWTKSLAGWITPLTWTPQRERYLVGPAAGAVRVELAPGRSLFVEGRLHIGFDADLPSEGVLVSIVDEDLPEGRGPLQLIVPQRAPVKKTSRRLPPLLDAAFQPGEGCAHAGVHVHVLARTPRGFEVGITRD